MVKLDLEVNEIVGLAENGTIDEKKLKKFLKASTKEELEDYIVQNAIGQEEDTEAEEDELDVPEYKEDNKEDSDL